MTLLRLASVSTALLLCSLSPILAQSKPAETSPPSPLPSSARRT